MRVLITGGAGYLGSHLVRMLVERGHEVRVFDRFCFSESSLKEFKNISVVEIIRGDIRRLQEHPGLFWNIDAVVHLAGLANDPSCDLDPDMTQDVNVDATIEVARRAIQSGVTRFVFASSCSVYGQGVYENLDETSPTNPVSAYAKSKLDAEKAIFAMASDTFTPVAARMATLFGWSERMRYDLAVNQMTATAVKSNVVKVMGGGNQWRPFVHVKDAAEAFILMLQFSPERVSGEAFNVGGNYNNVQISELAERVAAKFPGVKVERQLEDDDRRTYRVVFDKIREVLGFSVDHPIEEAVDEIAKDLQAFDYDPFDEQYFNVRRMQSLLKIPVELGGEPMSSRFIPLSKPVWDEAEEQAVVETMRSGWVTSGPQIGAFESALKETLEAEHVIATVSCTSAIHLCLVHLGVGPGDEVVLSPITWASIGNLVLQMGATPVFADVDRETLCMYSVSMSRVITEKTKAIIPVHMAGLPCEMEAIYAIARKHGVPVIEDAAHALGARYEGKPVGSEADFACFSFYAIKNVTTVEGGAVVCRDAEAAEHIRCLAANGMDANAWERYGRSAVPSPAEVVEPGFKYAMGNLSAAIGVEQLKKWPGFYAERLRLAALYRKLLANVDEVHVQRVPDVEAHAWHLMMIRLKLDVLTKTRDEIAYDLRQENIGTGVHFYGLHLHEYYRETLGYKTDDTPNATAVSHEVLSLPLYPGLSDKQVHIVTGALKKVLQHARK